MLSSTSSSHPLGHARPVDTCRRAATTALVVGHHAVRTAGRRRRAAPSRALAEELRAAFERLGPTYVKLGQLVASSPGLFPDVLAAEFRRCLDAVPAVPADIVRRIVEADLGAPIATLFAEFDDTPLAAASIAQVHAARCHDGAEVVVKVQRPALAGRLRADLAILRRTAGVVDRLSSTGRMANPVAVVEDFELTLSRELNFMTEARSMERFAENLRRSSSADSVRVPAVHWNLTSPRVLTMERIYGHKIDDVVALRDTRWDLARALKAAVRAWMEGALVHGFFHGDVHAGNLMIDDTGRVVFLDFGICGDLDGRTRNVICQGLPALLVERDFRKVASAVYDLGAILRPADLDQASRDVAELVTPVLERPLSEISYGEVLVDIIRVGARYEVRLPRELVLVAKQLLYFERYAKLLAPDWAVLDDPDLLSFLFGGTSR